ncbi:MAG: hypothetical protein LBD48_11750, partial [Treponema sp.]|nr:hypothetical protein [Treponema sp.]
KGGKAAASAGVATAAEPLSWLERVARIGELYKTLIRAEAKSGYRLDELLDTLSGAGGKTAAKKKSAVGKGDAGKPAANKGGKNRTDE